MTTPAQPAAAPRHARQRARPVAAARNRQAAQAAKPAPKPKAPPPTFRQQRAKARTKARTRQRAQLARTGAGATPEGAALYAADKGAQAARSAGRTIGQARITPGDRGYQPVLLAEFLAAVVIVALVPIAAGGSANAKVKGSPSPYDTGDLKQLVAVGALYFVLALASSGNSGRVSAWFGGLVLIGLAFAKLSHGQLQEVFRTVSGTAGQSNADLPAMRGLPGLGRVGR